MTPFNLLEYMMAGGVGLMFCGWCTRLGWGRRRRWVDRTPKHPDSEGPI